MASTGGTVFSDFFPKGTATHLAARDIQGAPARGDPQPIMAVHDLVLQRLHFRRRGLSAPGSAAEPAPFPAPAAGCGTRLHPADRESWGTRGHPALHGTTRERGAQGSRGCGHRPDHPNLQTRVESNHHLWGYPRTESADHAGDAAELCAQLLAMGCVATAHHQFCREAAINGLAWSERYVSYADRERVLGELRQSDPGHRVFNHARSALESMA